MTELNSFDKWKINKLYKDWRHNAFLGKKFCKTADKYIQGMLRSYPDSPRDEIMEGMLGDLLHVLQQEKKGVHTFKGLPTAKVAHTLETILFRYMSMTPYKNIFTISKERKDKLRQTILPEDADILSILLDGMDIFPALILIGHKELYHLEILDTKLGEAQMVNGEYKLIKDSENVPMFVCRRATANARMDPRKETTIFLPLDYDMASKERAFSHAPDMLQFLINFLLINQSRNIHYIYEEYNPVRAEAQAELNKGLRVRKNEKILAREDELRFVDLDLTLEKAAKEYREKHANGKTGRTVRAHYRRAHFNWYWTGPRKAGSIRKKVRHWIPETIVGNPDELGPDARKTAYNVIT
jgi:hypothetical protein